MDLDDLIGSKVSESSDIKSVISDAKFRNISQYPYVLRDIALWVPQQVESHKVKNQIIDNANDWLKDIRLFDVFEKEEKISYAFRIVFQSNEKTLSDKEVNQVMDKIYKAVEEEGWETR